MNRNGINLNRNWIEDGEPETGAAMRCIERVAGCCKTISFALDFHAGSISRNHVRGYAELDELKRVKN